MCTSDYQVEVDLGLSYTSGGKTMSINAQVIDSITTDYPNKDLDVVKQMPFLKGWQLTDPDLGLSEMIDLLLGVTDCNRCTEEGLAYSPDKCLVAQNTGLWEVLSRARSLITSALQQHLPIREPMR